LVATGNKPVIYALFCLLQDCLFAGDVGWAAAERGMDATLDERISEVVEPRPRVVVVDEVAVAQDQDPFVGTGQHQQIGERRSIGRDAFAGKLLSHAWTSGAPAPGPLDGNAVDSSLDSGDGLFLALGDDQQRGIGRQRGEPVRDEYLAIIPQAGNVAPAVGAGVRRRHRQ
jgi:hypothetical protein